MKLKRQPALGALQTSFNLQENIGTSPYFEISVVLNQQAIKHVIMCR